MRRAAIVTARALVVLLLAAAIADLPVPSESRARVRLHLIDRSGSVRVPGPPESLTPGDADRIREWDETSIEKGDTVLWASFGRDVRFASREVDPGATHLAGAIEAALARNPTEIILYTDGRCDPGRAPLLCRARGVPIHVLPLGPSSVRDARLLRVDAPSSAAPGERVTIGVTLESEFDGPATLRLDEETRKLDLRADAPVRVEFPDRLPGRFRIRLEAGDDCPQNDEAEGEIPVVSDRRRILVLSEGFPPLPEFDATVTPRWENPQGFDAVVVDNVLLPKEVQERLGAYVRDFGGGLLLLGGRKSHALGGWKGTPLEEISPLRSSPDHRVAVVFAIDRSGSMSQEGRLDAVLRAVGDAWGFFEEGDHAVAMASFPNVEFIESPGELRRIRATGGTNLAGTLREARRHLEQTGVVRKQIILLTDGESADRDDDTPETRREEGRELRAKGITLTVVTTNKTLEVGTQVRLDRWDLLLGTLEKLLPRGREVERSDPGRVDLREHPSTKGVSPFPAPWMNLASAKPDAQVAATVGSAPDLHPALAFRQGGRGRVAAFALEAAALPPRLLSGALAHVCGEGSDGLSLSIDPPVVRARGRGPAEILADYQATPSLESGTIVLRQVRSDVWEGALPGTRPGTLFVRHGRSRAAATIPVAAEYAALGVDREALERLAAETGGRVLSSSLEMNSLPRLGTPGHRSGRPFFLVAALALLFAEMAISTFWKT